MKFICGYRVRIGRRIVAYYTTLCTHSGPACAILCPCYVTVARAQVYALRKLHIDRQTYRLSRPINGQLYIRKRVVTTAWRLSGPATSREQEALLIFHQQYHFRLQQSRDCQEATHRFN